jgi:phosphoglycolate phosphatase
MSFLAFQGPPMRTVIFDLDGTLADTAPDLIGAANATAARRGWAALDPVADRGTAGHGGRAMLRLAATRAGAPAHDAAIEAAVPDFLRLYEARIADESRLFPGAVDCLDALSAGGWALGVCTNKPQGLARLLLEALGVAGRFGALVGADTLPVRKPDPAPLRHAAALLGARSGGVVMVGDTATDRLTARAAAVPCILCRFGYALEPLADLAAEAEIDSLDQTPAAAARLVATY